MATIDLKSIPRPARINLGYGSTTAYPFIAEDDEETKIINSFDPDKSGYVVIRSYANCVSKEKTKEVYLSYIDFLKMVKAYEENNDFRNSILVGYEKAVLKELRRLKATGVGFDSLRKIANDLGVSEVKVMEVFSEDE
ncbi:hypothetical protein [Methanococcus voltae]|uniref:Uncharacterized protein n=1 Tax=Methanococcus voltae TaxID=2188 RepID=A0A8J7UT79_METVO|nr:hypothetical protein [Methanococcus voltae]MBP2173311.1 hypothetical protein [Methanococcus voltae]MBP2201368.1 hypothetical protein [Methanococcus voltae]